MDVFERIESIAHESKRDERDTEIGARDNTSLEAGIPMKRAGSDMGRSLAIPLKSRQSSTTSLSDRKDFKDSTQITDPEWDHQAVLCDH